MRTVLAKVALVILLSFSFNACALAPIQKITANDIRDSKYYYSTIVMKKTIADIEQSVLQHRKNCRPIGHFAVDPSNPKEAHLVRLLTTRWVPGIETESIILLMDFFEDATKQETTIKAYIYYKSWDKVVNGIIETIENPESC